MASIAGLMGVSDRTAYNASKHGLIGLTRTLAAEWGGARRAVECCVSGMGEDGDGCRGPGTRNLLRCGHYRAQSDGAVCNARRCCARDCISGRSGEERLRQRAGVAGGWRLDDGRELGEPADEQAVNAESDSPSSVRVARIGSPKEWMTTAPSDEPGSDGREGHSLFFITSNRPGGKTHGEGSMRGSTQPASSAMRRISSSG